jgi:hypothetical protein
MGRVIYRKAAPHPPRMLLRIVATAGTGALLGVAACSDGGSAPAPITGSLPALYVPDASDDGSHFNGVAPCTPCGDDGDDGGSVRVVTGSLANPPDGGYPSDDASLDAPDDASPDAEATDASDAGSFCHGVCIGTVINPDR